MADTGGVKVAGVSAVMGADVAQFLQAMVQVQGQTRDAINALLGLKQAEAAQAQAAAAAAAEAAKLAAAHEAARKAANDQLATFKAFGGLAQSMAPAVASAKSLREAMAPAKAAISEISGALGDLTAIGAGLAAPFLAAFALIAAAVAVLVSGITSLGAALFKAFEVANSLSPSGIISYSAAVRRLQDEWNTLVGKLGEKVRPVIMAVLKVASDLLDVLNRVKWQKIADEGSDAFTRVLKAVRAVWTSISDGAGTVLSVVGPIFETLARIATYPFDLMREVSSKALATILDMLGWLLSKGAPILEQVARMLAFPFEVMLRGATAAIAGVLELVASLAKAMPQGLRERFKLDGFAESVEQISGLVEKLGKVSPVDLAKQALPDVKTVVDGIGEASNRLRQMGETSTVDAVKAAGAAIGATINNIVTKAKEAMKGLVSTGPAELKQKNTEGDNLRAQLKQMLADADQQVQNMGLKLVAAKLQANKAMAVSDEQQLAAQTEAAEVAASSARTKLTEAYAKGSEAQIVAALKAYEIAEQTVQMRKQAEIDLLGTQEKAAAATAGAMAAQIEGAVAKVLAARAKLEEAADVVAANANNVGDGSILQKAQSDLQIAQKALASAEAAEGVVVEKFLAANQQAIDLNQKANEKANKDKLDTARKAAELDKEAADYRKRLGDYLASSGRNVLTGAGGTTGSVASGAFQGLDSAGPVGALVGGIIGLLTKSRGFQQLVEALNTLLDSVGNAVGLLLEGLSPLLAALTHSLAPLLNGLGAVLGAVAQGVVATLMPMMPGLEALARGLGNLLLAIAPLVAPFMIVAEALTLLTPALVLLSLVLGPFGEGLQLLAEAVAFVTDAIRDAWNWMVNALQKFLRSLGDVPVVGDTMKALATTLDSFKVQVTDSGSAVSMAMQGAAAASQSVETAFQRLYQQAQAQLGTAQNSAQDAEALRRAASEAQTRAAASPNDPVLQAYAEAVQKAADDAQKQAVAEMDRYRVEQAQAVLSQFTQGSDEYNAALKVLGQALAQQAYDSASNTQATKENTAAVNAMAGILNAPQGFRLDGYTFGAIGSQSAIDQGAGQGAPTFTGSRQAQAPTNVTINVHVDKAGATGEDIGKAVKKAIEEHNFRSNGTVAGSIGSRWANAGLGR